MVVLDDDSDKLTPDSSVKSSSCCSHVKTDSDVSNQVEDKIKKSDITDKEKESLHATINKDLQSAIKGEIGSYINDSFKKDQKEKRASVKARRMSNIFDKLDSNTKKNQVENLKKLIDN